MEREKAQDIYDRMSRNRLRLAAAIVLVAVIIMAFSGLAIYLLLEALSIGLDFWLPWTLFWLLCLLYVLLRYVAGGRWLLKGVAILPEWKVDRRLKDALMAASLASDMLDSIRLYEIPDDDINAFTLALPDGTFALFVTRGVSRKMSLDGRVAVIAHEIAHMRSGDTTIYTIMIRLAGRRSLKKMVGGMPGEFYDPLKWLHKLVVTATCFAVAASMVVNISRGDEFTLSSSAFFWTIIAVLLVVAMVALPPVISSLLKVFLDRNREYNADMQAVYITRDPGAVYGAIRMAAEDVMDVILLPACFDALLFCPVVNYSYYKPFRTQPTMAQRMERLREAFPGVTK
ncbi:MAG: M48 family metalloprotease [Actinomycetota bacterium]